ncbi:MAG: amino acid adenylation domain-containing protein [Gemmatimonadota bacterium]|nr:MAG: amino acid adenylation domain-containing protein [Gemmatimonadota bacterium]
MRNKDNSMGKQVFVFPTSFAQQRLWFLNQLDPENPVYNIPRAFRVTGPLDVEALEHGLNEIIRRHEILRTTFSHVDGEPVQIIAEAMPLKVSVIDMGDIETIPERKTKQLIIDEIQRPFNLSQGPLLRANLLRLAEEEHILLLTIHHIVADGWSMGILYQELSTLYKAFVSKSPFSMPELPIQYVDFAVWQREWLQGEILETQLAYWRAQLKSAPPVLEFPTDHPRSPTSTFRGARQSLVLSKTLGEALDALSQREGVTLFMTLLAAFTVLLHRYTGQDIIVVGTPIAGRNRPEIEGLIGFFVNTLVMSTDLSGNPSFREVLVRVREVCLGAYDHQDLPFETLVEELRPERNLNQSPLFQMMFALQNAPESDLILSDVTVHSLEVSNGRAKFDLALSMVKGAEGLTGTVEYSTDLFEAATIKRFLTHYQNVLEAIASDPEQLISTVPLLTQKERHQMLVEWNDAKVDYPQNTCIHQLFEEYALRTPEEVAVVFEGQQMTYEELNTRSNRLAHCLIKNGVGPETLVGICVDRSLEMMVGLLGILKAGGAYVPLNPDDPEERRAFMLKNARVRVVLTLERLVPELPESMASVICLDTEWSALSQYGEKNPSSGVQASNLAYVMYTSGSTGKPKGVMITHRNVVGFLYSYKQVTLDGETRVGTSVAPFSFDTSVEEFFSTLCFGGTLHLIRPERSVDGEYFAHYLIDHGITTTYIVPALLPEIASHLERMKDRMKLECVITGLQPKTEEVLQHFRNLSENLRILNAYGPTETTYGATAFNFRQATSPDRDVPIGVPFPNYQTYIVDSNLKPVPIGARGEILIGGIGLARGYLHQPELTDEKFIPNPFSDEPDARLYRTGDVGRYLPDGTIEFLGRTDHQVKIRGFRIELGEVEVLLGQHPAVQETVVLAREDTPGDKRLVAYLVINQESAPSTSELRRFLGRKLPEHMVPSAFVVLDALPLTSSGKVDRQALPPPDQDRPELEGAFKAPQDTLELHLTKIWEKVLGVQPIGVRDNFFELGGHSLLAVRLFEQIKKVLGKSLPLSTLFKGSTVEELAHVIRQEEWSDPWSCLVPIQPSGTKIPLLCVAPAAGEVISFAGISRCLGHEQPFYGLRLPREDGASFSLRVEDMAAQCIREIETLQPEGPYLLGGACMGGLVAFEMACQLHEQGKEVAVLFLLDSSQPPPLISLRNYIPQLLFHHLPRGQLTYCLLRDLREKGRKLKRKFPLNREGRNLSSVWKAHEKARRAYVPRVYPGRITLFQSREFHIRFPDCENRWSALAEGGLDCHILPCGHGESLREPHVRILAEELKAHLTEVQARKGTGRTKRI